jgi:hypothetical protein
LVGAITFLITCFLAFVLVAALAAPPTKSDATKPIGTIKKLSRLKNLSQIFTEKL